MFSARKVGQMAAFFADRQGGRINILKLMKLLYLADRESMVKHGEPISFDRFVSMDHGPVLSRTLNLINGTYPEHIGADWEEWISDRDNHEVACNRRVQRGDLDCLSEIDLQILSSVWQQFGHMNQWELCDYTHDHLPEWHDPSGSSTPIPEAEIFRAIGLSAEEAQELADAISAEHEIDLVLARF